MGGVEVDDFLIAGVVDGAVALAVLGGGVGDDFDLGVVGDDGVVIDGGLDERGFVGGDVLGVVSEFLDEAVVDVGLGRSGAVVEECLVFGREEDEFCRVAGVVAEGFECARVVVLGEAIEEDEQNAEEKTCDNETTDGGSHGLFLCVGGVEVSGDEAVVGAAGVGLEGLAVMADGDGFVVAVAVGVGFGVGVAVGEYVGVGGGGAVSGGFEDEFFVTIGADGVSIGGGVSGEAASAVGDGGAFGVAGVFFDGGAVLPSG